MLRLSVLRLDANLVAQSIASSSESSVSLSVAMRKAFSPLIRLALRVFVSVLWSFRTALRWDVVSVPWSRASAHRAAIGYGAATGRTLPWVLLVSKI